MVERSLFDAHMRYPIRLATLEDIPQIVAITNREALRSAATVSLSEEPVSRWLESYQQTHERYPWLVAIDSQASSTNQVVAYAKGSPYRYRFCEDAVDERQ